LEELEEHRQREPQQPVQEWGFHMIDVDLEGNEIVEVVLMVESILADLVEGRKLVGKKPVEEGWGEDRNLMHPRIHRMILCRRHYLGRLRYRGEGCSVPVHHGECDVLVHEGE
jgi:hypothetical protein